MTPPGSVDRARCPAAGSIRLALNRAISLVVREWCLTPSCQPLFKGRNCSALRVELSGWKSQLKDGLSESAARSLSQALKSCDRFFDVQCKPCDKVAVGKARSQWQREVATPVSFDPSASASWSKNPLGELARRVKNIVGTEWGKEMERYRQSCLVPDQNGCLETPRGEGGTLATAPEDYSSDTYGLRVGVAKTKGKFRVVTMQSARVKGVLRPVHECLYDFLSRRAWLVRGDIREKDVRGVFDDLEEGENVISGDYKAATNNIYTTVVEAVVDVLASCPYLTHEERELMVGSFRPENLHWVSRTGVSHPILRGSMMGNLLSFPILCLINRASWSIADSLRRKRTGSKKYRRLLVNGDDIAFCGDGSMYQDWRSVTSWFGLVVNEEKTGVSSRFLELNSRSFERKAGGRIRPLRKPVLSGLMPDNTTSCVLTRLWDGLRTFTPSSLRIAILWLRNEIVWKGVSLSGLPSRLRRVLLKEAWFRQALWGGADVVEKVAVSCSNLPVVDRHWPVVSKGWAPPPECYELYDSKVREAQSIGVALARGFKCVPKEEILCGCRACRTRNHRAPSGRIWFRSVWKWRWISPVWNWWRKSGLPLVPVPTTTWADDHPDLASGVEVMVQNSFPPPPSLLYGVTVDDVILWPNGPV
uniref:RNA-dependent RNA polymerase n=1 Tax=Tianjin Botou tick virus 2 TaxID=2972070 RepID=A0A9E8A9I0_9VIRU|nr:MAG: RNA-dependent RNA polymerase [Tianjin Botou tick virus 2]